MNIDDAFKSVLLEEIQPSSSSQFVSQLQSLAKAGKPKGFLFEALTFSSHRSWQDPLQEAFRDTKGVDFKSKLLQYILIFYLETKAKAVERFYL